MPSLLIEATYRAADDNNSAYHIALQNLIAYLDEQEETGNEVSLERKVLQALEQVYASQPEKTTLVTTYLQHTLALMQTPNVELLNEYYEGIKQFNGFSAKKTIIAVLTAFAALTLIGISVGLAFISFGAAAPISILGLTFGASSLVGALAILATSISIATIGGLGFWAGNNMRKRDEEFNVLKEVSFMYEKVEKTFL